MHFVSKGHSVHATDISDGMIREIRSKISNYAAPGRFTCQQLSFEQLDQLEKTNFDYVFSNFGGLNCIQDLFQVTRHLPTLLKPGGFVTLVIMPPLCPWEIMWIFKGKWAKAFRRLNKNGVLAHVEGEYFKTYYHSLKSIRRAMGQSFLLIRSEGLAVLSPQPHHLNFPNHHPRLYRFLRKADAWLKNKFPFNGMGDHIIVTFQYLPER